MKLAHSQIVRHTELESSYIPVALRRTILEKQNYTCYFCGKKTNYLCHDLPKCRGGKTELSNLLACCIPCRRQKEELTAQEYLSYIKLEEKDIFKEEIMFVKVYFLDGETIEGETVCLPNKGDNGFYLNPTDNGERIWIGLHAIKKFEVKSMREKEKGG